MEPENQDRWRLWRSPVCEWRDFRKGWLRLPRDPRGRRDGPSWHDTVFSVSSWIRRHIGGAFLWRKSSTDSVKAVRSKVSTTCDFNENPQVESAGTLVLKNCDSKASRGRNWGPKLPDKIRHVQDRKLRKPGSKWAKKHLKALWIAHQEPPIGVVLWCTVYTRCRKRG